MTADQTRCRGSKFDSLGFGASAARSLSENQLFPAVDDTAMIGDTIVVLADPTEAANLLAKATGALGTSVTGAPAPSPIGTNGTVAAGTSPDGSKAATVVMFTNDNAFVTLQFDSSEGDLNPVPPDYVESVGQLQLEALKAE